MNPQFVSSVRKVPCSADQGQMKRARPVLTTAIESPTKSPDKKHMKRAPQKGLLKSWLI